MSTAYYPMRGGKIVTIRAANLVIDAKKMGLEIDRLTAKDKDFILTDGKNNLAVSVKEGNAFFDRYGMQPNIRAITEKIAKQYKVEMVDEHTYQDEYEKDEEA